ncbi:tRNA-splicing endonuclease subunit Sen15-like [Bacillus rossius redtenbacheri]|uniref:tRNA-splicing endonuclease subunit Sen15-like n=1 Tax=Bacillus rossius redtenbacheri TaxID=93214 RepID=UPI002FDDD146
MDVLEDMLSLGCKHQLSATIALHVYMELCEVHVLWDVKYFYSQELEMMYLTARRTRTSPVDIYIPVSSTASISPQWIDKVQDVLCKGEGPKSIILAVKDRHSAVVYHRLTEGLVVPDSPNTAKQRKQKVARSTAIEGQLQARRLELFKMAKDSAES